MSGLPPVDGASLLPHDGPARFVDEIVDAGDGTLACVGRISEESPFTRDGVVPGFALLELAAQAAAIEILATMAGEDPRPRVGFLARTRGLSWTPDGVPAGARLTARVCREGAIPPLYTFDASVTLGGVEVFRGEFSLFVDEEIGAGGHA